MLTREPKMFHSPEANLIESDEGFSVEILGRTGLLYREGDHSMRVDSELLAEKAGIAVYRNSVKQWKPPHQELIDEAKREMIIDNIRRALRFQGCEIQIMG
jgi:Immunity protein 74